MTAQTGIGARVKRKEDHRFLTGTGRYVDDLPLARATYAQFVRSPHAHAKIKSIDTSAAKAMAGVVAIFTGKDVADAKVGGLICGWVVKDKHGEPHKAPPHPVMAVDTVRYVGDTVAMVVANSHDEAKDAAEAIKIDYDVKAANVDLARALDKGAPEVHPEAPGNLIYDWEIGVKADVDAAFAKAAHVTKIDIVNNRLIPNAMEPRAAAADYDKGTGNYTLWSTSQNPHVLRLILSAFVLGIPEHKLRVIAPDVGGGFGSKIFCYADETMVCWAASRVGRPIKWTAERSESFLTDAHGRDHVSTAELAMDAQGNFLALRVKTIANMGAYLSTFASAVPTILYATLLAGQYKTPAIYAEVKAVFTNTAPVDAYRGAGRPEATYLLERTVEQAAREMKIDPAEIRRRNFITTFPYATPVGLTYDVGNYGAHLEKAITMADTAGFKTRK
ncbi:MAG TPA: xanthine dehydrogenase family protein molybdopterin-binding subunit, partial [Reyranella sp.]|nr:xanthine dehydrogenase family protein molybdopterin-binding subunit [Reyranella sp.]